MSYKVYEVRVHKDGTEEWSLNGLLHREDGPAYKAPDGSLSWWLNGKLHREDGPAREYANGNRYWYLNGEKLSEAEFNKRLSPVVEMTVSELAEKLGIDPDKLKVIADK